MERVVSQKGETQKGGFYLEAAGTRKQTLPSPFPCWSPEQLEQ